MPQLGEHGQVTEVKPRPATATQSPRPRDSVFPEAAGDAREREVELREEARENSNYIRKSGGGEPNQKTSLHPEVFQDF